MNYKKQILEAKEYLKSTAVKIRKAKYEYKEAQRKGSASWSMLADLNSLRWEYRHEHIAYSLAKGNKYEEIERTVAEGNEPDWKLIDKISSKYKVSEDEEAVRVA